MANADRQLAFTTGPVPTSVQVSGPDRVTPKSVNATFDGSGAGGAFLPCLIITGRTGLEVARIPAPQVAAGASAEVSWFPRVAGAPATAGGVTATTEYARDGGAVNVPGNGVLGGPIVWQHTPGSAVLLDYTNPAAPTIIASGIYAISVNVYMATNFFTGGFMAVFFNAGPTAFLKGVCAQAIGSIDTPEVVLTLPPLHFAAGDALALGVRQNSGQIRAYALQSPVGAIITRLT